MPIDARFRAGGLASGLDSNSIVEQLVKLESRPLALLSGRQSALKSQVSLLGELSGKLAALEKAAEALGKSGVARQKVAQSPTSATVVPTQGGTAGRFELEVHSLAQAARARSQGFASAAAPVRGGSLALTVQGQAYAVTIADGASLQQVADALNTSGAPVSAAVISDGVQSYLTLSNRQTGYPLSGAPGDALQVVETSTGSAGQPLGIAITQTAANAQFTLDGLTMTRQSNEVTDAVAGVRLTLKAESPAGPEELVLEADAEATAQNLQTFVTAYNEALALLQKQLAVAPAANRDFTLAGDTTVRGLAASLQRLVSTTVGSSGSVRALADLGLKTNRDGSLSLDTAALAAAVARAPQAVEGLFSSPGVGLSAVTSTLVGRYTNSLDGLLPARQKSLGQSIDRMDDQLDKLQVRLDTYRQNLIRQFSAMESVVSGLKSIGNYLSQTRFPSIGGGDAS